MLAAARGINTKIMVMDIILVILIMVSILIQEQIFTTVILEENLKKSQ